MATDNRRTRESNNRSMWAAPRLASNNGTALIERLFR
jgi:hypothetical protein